MSKRREALKNYFAPVLSEEPTPAPSARPHQASSMKAMGLSLAAIAEDVSELAQLRERVASADAIQEIDPHLIDGSFIQDRIGSSLDELTDLAHSIEECGQQVPVLLRNNPKRPGRFEAAYGHRRIAACLALGRPVRAIIRQMTDDELVIAQGKENLERKDLSFIERALFATRLEERGFSRATLTSALGVHKGNLSTMIGLVKKLSVDLILRVGPAPKIGRPRWEALASTLDTSTSKTELQRLLLDPSFEALESNRRFEQLFAAAQPPKAVSKAAENSVRIKRSGPDVCLIMNAGTYSAFAEYLAAKFPELFDEFQKSTRQQERS